MDPDLIGEPLGLAQIRTWRETRSDEEPPPLGFFPDPCFSLTCRLILPPFLLLLHFLLVLSLLAFFLLLWFA